MPTCVRWNGFNLITVLALGLQFGMPLRAQSWGQKLTQQTSPPLRGYSAMAFDGSHRQVVLFGGQGATAPLGDTWIWDGTNWTIKSPATSPSARIGHAMVTDAAGHVLLFGGLGASGMLADTWVWDGANWTRQAPSTSPPARAYHAMAYEASSGKIVLFGGEKSNASALADTWIWDGTTWTQQSPSSSPPARFQSAMAYDPANHVVLFGGQGASFNMLADTWVWDGTNWTQPSVQTAPSGRDGHAMAYDAAHNQTMLFGGSPGSTTVLADSWIWNGTKWTQQSPATAPAARADSAMGYDALHGQTLLFGGTATTGSFSDTWLYPARSILASAGYPLSVRAGFGFPLLEITATDVNGNYIAGEEFPFLGVDFTVFTDATGRYAVTGFTNSNPGLETYNFTAPDGGSATFVTAVVNSGGGSVCQVTSGADDLSAGTLRSKVANCGNGAVITFAPSVTTVTLSQGFDIGLVQDLTIDGGSGVTIDANHQSRIFFITGGTVTLKNLTLANGLAEGGNGGNGTISGGGGAGMGGAIFQNGGVLGLNNVTFSNNQALGGTGGAAPIGATGGTGGGGGMSGAGGTGGFGATPQNGNGAGGGDFITSGGTGGDGTGGSGGSTGGAGGFAGGGGAGTSTAGAGGFGGASGGGANAANGGPFAGSGGTGSNARGGGGAGLGGAIFARTGVLVLQSVSFSSNSANKGSAGGTGATDGQGKGGALFIMSTVTAVYLGAAPSYSGDSAGNQASGTLCNTVVGATAADTNDICGILTQVVSITATSGSGQSAPLDQFFTNRLVVTVVPAISGLPIEFDGPTTSASWIPVTYVATTDDTGVASCCSFPNAGVQSLVPPFANDTPGTYTITTTLAGLSISPAYTLTNLNPPSLNVSKTHVGTFAQGGTGEWDIAVTNSAGSSQSGGLTTLSDTLPTGYTVNSFSNTDSSWTCSGLNTQTASCTTFQSVNGGSSYKTVKIIANIPATSAASVTNTASVYGGSDPNHQSNHPATGSDTVNVIQTATSIAATNGTLQNVTLNQSAATNLQALVKDAASAVIANASVTFTAPSTGASGTFGAPCNATTCVVKTDATGTATAPVFTANGTPGTYTVTAAVGTLSPVNYSLTNVGSDLTVQATHTGNVAQGEMAAIYTVTVTNAGVGPTLGLVQVVDTLSAGLTATGISGPGWSCVLATLTCSRMDVLAAGSSYPSISLTVSVSATAPASGTNQAVVSGGSEVNLSNDTATDPITINPIVDVSAEIRVTTTGFVRNHATGLWGATMTVTNTGAASIIGPIQVVLTNLTAGVTMTNNTGIWNGSPYLTVLGTGSLAAGASTSIAITFTNPSNSFINFVPTASAGIF